MWQQIVDTLTEFNFWSVTFRLLLAVLISGVLGMERRLKNRAAGFRTYILVCLGAALATMTGLYYADQTGATGEATRIAAQVISGIGFLGAGTILVTKDRKIEGLTTASGLWTVASIGVALGMGFYVGAILAGVIVFLTLTILETFEDYLVSKRHDENFYIELADISMLKDFLAHLESLGLEPVETGITKAKDPSSNSVGIDLKLRLAPGQRAHELIRQLSSYPGLLYILSVNEQ